METFVRRFIRSSLVWLGVGVVLGTWMAMDTSAIVYRPAHLHANLLGFVSMMIFGVAYHVIPRFTGAPLWSRQAASLHVWVANIGLALMIGGWLARMSWPQATSMALAVGGTLSAAGAFLFIGNLWRTLAPRGPAPMPGTVGARPASAPMPRPTTPPAGAPMPRPTTPPTASRER